MESLVIKERVYQSFKRFIKKDFNYFLKSYKKQTFGHILHK